MRCLFNLNHVNQSIGDTNMKVQASQITLEVSRKELEIIKNALLHFKNEEAFNQVDRNDADDLLTDLIESCI